MQWRLTIATTLSLIAAELGIVRAQDYVPTPFYDFNNSDTSTDQQTESDLLPGYSPYLPISYFQNQAAPNQPAAQPGQQPQPALRPNPQPPANPLANMQNRRPSLARLNRAPDLFGDSFTPLTVGITGQNFDNLGVTSITGLNGNYQANVPLGAGTRRFKNEQTRALPTDRVIFIYNHFHNAIELNHVSGAGPRSDIGNVDQFTFGFEKTFGDGDWSIEARMPFAANSDLSLDGIAVNNGTIGNLTLTLKRLLYRSEDMALAAGLAVTSPTGNDTEFNISKGLARITIDNQAVHLLPYVGLLMTPTDEWFVNAFAQVDVATNPNGVTLTSNSLVAPISGDVIEQTVMYLDLSLGYWLYRSDEDEGLTGLASVLEFHYTSTLNDAQITNLGGAGFLNVGNGINRFDVVNMTTGIHSEWSRNTLIRTAVVVPLTNEINRFFDAEIQVSVIHRF